MTGRLDAGDAFPAVALTLADGGRRTLPDDLDSPWTAVLFYRGHW